MSKVKKLNKQKVIYILPLKPFNFNGTFIKPSHFSSKLVVYCKNRVYHSIDVDGRVLGVEIYSSGLNKQRVAIGIYAEKEISSSMIKSVKRMIISMYNLDGDIKLFIDQYKHDEILAGPIKRWGGMRPSTSYSLYGFLMVATLLQNATIKRTVQMMETLLNNYGTKLVFAGKEVYSLWKPADMNKVSEIELRSLRIGYRAKNIKRISEAFFTKKVSEEFLSNLKSQQEVKAALLEIYGVGPQSVAYLLFEAFHYYDALDHLSPWEGKIVSMLIYNNKTTDPSRTLKYVEKRWGKWKMLAIHYIFEDLFWRRENETIPWLEEEIRM